MNELSDPYLNAQSLAEALPLVIPDAEFRCPIDLAVTKTQPKRVAIIGQCLMVGWGSVIEAAAPGCRTDYLLFNLGQDLPDNPPHDPTAYDFQLIGLPLRSIIPEVLFLRLPYHDISGYEALLETACQRLRQALRQALAWNVHHCMLSFVCNFILPQQNPTGRLLPRYDIRNFVHFVERLNEVLASELALYKNAYLFDYDQIVASLGRKYFQDDVVWLSNHNGAMIDESEAAERLEQWRPASQFYPTRTHTYVLAGCYELIALWRTIRQIDMVKLVIVDLDDTLWRGVGVESGAGEAPSLEGWPLGIAESLLTLKRRGVLIALVSKNEESLVTPLWQELFASRFLLEDFAIKKINWQPKADNIEKILEEANLLARNVVFIDDNPLERAAIKAAFPDMRVLGRDPILTRRILLWSPETQVAVITAESEKRTEMIRAQVRRETERKQMSREEFLTSLGVKIKIFEISDTSHQRFKRAFELVNKSNQFNTTGKRWTEQEWALAATNGTRFIAFDVEDRFTPYGLVGVVTISGSTFIQFVMSCRVNGLDVEIAVIASILNDMRSSHSMATAHLKETNANLVARNLWRRCGFALNDNAWSRSLIRTIDIPPHISLGSSV
jgi:FkbH-like protein